MHGSRVFSHPVTCIYYSYSYYICLVLWNILIVTCCSCFFITVPAHLSLAARIIHNIHSSYNSVLAAANNCLLLGEALGSSRLILEKYYARTSFCQCHYNDPQSNFTQQPRINFPEFWTHLWNSRNSTPRENNLLYGSYTYHVSENTYII